MRNPVMRRSGPVQPVLAPIAALPPSGRIGQRGLSFLDPTNTMDTAITTVAPFLSMTQFCFEFFIVVRAYDNVNQQLIFRNRNANTGIDFRLNSSPLGTISLIFGNGTTSTFCTSTALVPLGRLIHVAGYYDTANIRVAVEGNIFATTALAAASTGNPGISANIGNSFTNSVTPMHGAMFGGRVSSIPRYGAVSFSVPRSPFVGDANTLAIWNMNEGNGRTLFDTSGNGAHATFTGLAEPTWVPGYF